MKEKQCVVPANIYKKMNFQMHNFPESKLQAQSQYPKANVK